MGNPGIAVLIIFAIGFLIQLFPRTDKVGSTAILIPILAGITVVAIVAIYWLVLRQVGVTVLFR